LIQMSIVTPFVYLIAVVAVVTMWRGIWGLLDEYLLPHNKRLSLWISFLLGFIGIIFVLFMTPQ
jgi:succinate dehydrogenase hydrophobic anchor subunit